MISFNSPSRSSRKLKTQKFRRSRCQILNFLSTIRLKKLKTLLEHFRMNYKSRWNNNNYKIHPRVIIAMIRGTHLTASRRKVMHQTRSERIYWRGISWRIWSLYFRLGNQPRIQVRRDIQRQLEKGDNLTASIIEHLCPEMLELPLWIYRIKGFWDSERTLETTKVCINLTMSQTRLEAFLGYLKDQHLNLQKQVAKVPTTVAGGPPPQNNKRMLWSP